MDLTSIEFEIRKWETVRKSARYTILLLVALTIVNAVVQIAGGTFYLLYSDRAAFYLILLAAAIFYAGSTNEYDVLPEGVGEHLYPITGGVILAIALVILGLFVLSFFLSKKKKGFMILALVLISLDTLILLVTFDIDSIFDILIHGLIIYELVRGVMSYSKVSALEKERDRIVKEQEAIKASEYEDPYEQVQEPSGGDE